MKPDPSAEKKTRNPERTKAEILKAAEAAFAAKGFEGCSLSDILCIAKVNKRMIYHYFGDKQGLYEAIFTGMWKKMRDDIGDQVLNAEGNPHEKIKKVMFTIFEYYHAHPNFVRLVMWEGLEGQRISAETWSQVRGPVYRPIIEYIQEAQSQGLLDKRLDPVHLIISFLADILFYFAHSQGMVANMLHVDGGAASTLESRRQHLDIMLDRFF